MTYTGTARGIKHDKYFHTLTSDEDVLDDMSHEPWVWVHCNTLAFMSSHFVIMFGDGATLSSSMGATQNCDDHSELWKNVWVSKNEDRQCVSSSLSNLLYFMGDEKAGDQILNVHKIYHDKVQLSKKYETMSYIGFEGNVPLDWMMTILKMNYQYIYTGINESMVQTPK